MAGPTPDLERKGKMSDRLFKIQQGADELSIYVQTEKFIALKQSGWTHQRQKFSLKKEKQNKNKNRTRQSDSGLLTVSHVPSLGLELVT